MNIIKDLKCKNYSIFTGTVGENRKIVVELNDGENTKYFLKIPTTQSAKELVQNEAKSLKFLEQYEFKLLDFPKVAYSDEKVVVISNIKPNQKVENGKFDFVDFIIIQNKFNHLICSFII